MQRTKAFVTPALMKWARMRARLDIETAATKIQRTPEEIRAWEDGTLQPTLAQAIKASKVYKRSLSVFYLPEPPQEFDTLQDFRHLPSGFSHEYSPELALLIRRLQSRQLWMREYLISDGRERLNFVGSASIHTSEKDLAAKIRQTIGVSLKEQLNCPTSRDALNLWVEKSEQAGIFISREGGIESEEARGIFLADDYAPFVYINTNDSYASRLFTLAHELAHLWINQPGLSNLRSIKAQASVAKDAIEVFCNKIAALTLVDDNEFANQWNARDESALIQNQIHIIAQYFKVSDEVIARRLMDKRIIRSGEYEQLRELYHSRWLKHVEKVTEKQKSDTGGPSYYLRKIHANGQIFTYIIIAACASGDVPLRDTCAILGVKVGQLPRLAKDVGIELAMHGGLK